MLANIKELMINAFLYPFFGVLQLKDTRDKVFPPMDYKRKPERLKELKNPREF